MSPKDFQDAVRSVRILLTLPPKVDNPVLIILSGLPGSGKTTFASKVALALPAIVVESDMVRHALFPERKYSNEENRVVHAVAHALMRYYLRLGRNTVADATNLARWHRQMLLRLAQNLNVPAIVVQTRAPEGVIAERLGWRSSHKPENDFSDADWRVYQKLAASAQAVQEPHLRIDTTKDLEAGVKRTLSAVKRARLEGGNTHFT